MIPEKNRKPGAVADDEDDVMIRPRKAPVPEAVLVPEEILRRTATAWEDLRAKCPLVECLTNYVSAPLVADGLLALGASPAMIADSGEATAFAAACDALLVNVGTLDRAQADAMRAAVARANVSSHPWVLDPVGVGSLSLRTYLARELMRRFPAVIRGNASEILVLAGVVGAEKGGRGVDSTAAGETVLAEARRLAEVTHAAVVVSGAVDYVASEHAPTVAVDNGSPLMAQLSGTGCLQGAVAAAFAGTLGGQRRLDAALAGAVVCGVAGQQAAKAAKGPGSFRAAFLDALASLKGADIVKLGNLEIVQ